MTPRWDHLVRVLLALEETLPYVTTDELRARLSADWGADAADEIAAAVADGRLFTDQRQRLDPQSGAVEPVRLVRLNRRHAAVAAVLDALGEAWSTLQQD